MPKIKIANERVDTDWDLRRITAYSIRGFCAKFNGIEVTLTPSEFNLLYALAKKPGTLLARDVLLDAMYAETRFVTDRTVDTHLKNLRRKGEAVGARTISSVTLTS